MKIFFWIYVRLFILTFPLFVYDMYVERSVNLTYIAAGLLAKEKQDIRTQEINKSPMI